MKLLNKDIEGYKCRQFGLKAIEVRWPNLIDPKILGEIQSFKIEAKRFYGSRLKDIVNGYASVLLTFHKHVNLSSETTDLENLLFNLSNHSSKSVNHRWFIPVCYHPELGIDINEFCRAKHITEQELISIHCATDYPLYFFGFLPGFMYLGGLSSKLHYPRKALPRSKVAEGSVAIGGKQTGIYPQDSPGGWHIIGRTPIQLFNVTKEDPVFALAGDAIQFYPIELQEYKTIYRNRLDFTVRKEVLP